ncbi:hypothetical protein [Nocardia miyunensis]|uniref:hypothetical protein n=1 Tax=Nocardia miyunensis TaxID=282684 RepID=UPI000A4BBAA3|nr:hypothetical protein [Nocardia miyunensis]
MALALCLDNHNTPPQRLETAATLTLDRVNAAPTIVSSAPRARAPVPGLAPADFKTIVDEAAALCAVSRLFAEVEVTVDAELDTQ